MCSKIKELDFIKFIYHFRATIVQIYLMIKLDCKIQHYCLVIELNREISALKLSSVQPTYKCDVTMILPTQCSTEML